MLHMRGSRPDWRSWGFIAHRLFAAALASLTLILLPGLALGAELQIRESLLQAQRDRVTATITAVADHIGVQAHPLSEDCDLHVPLRSREIRVPFIGEVKNACSEKPAGTPLSFWSDQIYEETHGRAVSVTGVFRIWLEHPPAGAVVQTESQRVPWYANSNPDHQLELHPITQIGALDFLGHVKRIRDGSQSFTGYGPTQLTTILNKKITIQRTTIDGEPYVTVRGTKTGNNHWDLRARVLGSPETMIDGARIRLDVLQGAHVVAGALSLSAVAVSGTIAHSKIQTLSGGDIIRFQALIRMHVPTILDQVTSTAQEIPLPVEFVLLDLY